MIKISIGEKIKLKELLELLIQKGYWRDFGAQQSGTFSMQGDALLIWPINQSEKYRLDLFGNIVENIFKQGHRQKQSIKKLEILENIIFTEDGQRIAPVYVVHPHHGIGIFKTIITRQFDQKLKQFILLEYAKEDKIYFPIERSRELLTYLGSRKPRLTRLNSGSWEKTKKRISKNLLILARELLEIYSQRSINKRSTYKADKSFLEILAKSFEYQLTLDQEKSLLEIIAGLTEKDCPQDHLLVGDVGFGKTEVALRAASIVLANGKQVAILAPTTVLAAQHTALIRERFKDLPLKVAELSRFNQKTHGVTVQEINTGKADIIVGTHRLLSLDVHFKDLGMLIVDEEQRFGVEQKEKLKKLRQNVDVLSLSATPIPRTLFMSLSGLRNLSLISKPPLGRKGIKTQVGPFRNSEIARVIKREIDRKGQIYYIHNRVQNIHVAQQKLIKILQKNQIKAVQYRVSGHKKDDGVIIAIAHGQMPENALADVMSKFIAGDIDILISSTVVENGLDHPNANTLIVEDVERFGLADLYQLRGRIGRRHRQAYALFCIGNILSGENDIPIVSHKARERLIALTDVEEIGGGWQLALKDIEIRGSGNLLGREQHGYMEAIGLLLYSKLLKEAIDQVKREQLKKHFTARIESD